MQLRAKWSTQTTSKNLQQIKKLIKPNFILQFPKKLPTYQT